MPWGAWTLTDTTTWRISVCSRKNVMVNLATSGVSDLKDFPAAATLLYAPFLRGKLEIRPDNTLGGVGASRQFPMGPKWRKVIKEIGKLES